jgi:hypothetical protein
MGYYVVFLDRLERLGEAALVSNGASNFAGVYGHGHACEAAEDSRCVAINFEGG